MSAKAVLDHPQFENAEEEIEYWKNLFLVRDAELTRVLKDLSLERGTKRLASPIASPAPKRFDKDSMDNSMDPLDFNNICEDVQNRIMEYFSGEELLVMSEVSNDWNNRLKAEINSKTILNLTKKLKGVEDVKDFTRQDHNYRAISVDCEAFSRIGASLFADTVETLKFTNEQSLEPRVNFPKLKKLELYVTKSDEKPSWTLISQLKLNELEELKITNNSAENVHGGPFCIGDQLSIESWKSCKKTWSNFFNSMKNLKHLDLDTCCTLYIFGMLNHANIQIETLRTHEIKCDQKFFKKLKQLTLVGEFTLGDNFNEFKELTTLELESFMSISYNPTGSSLPINRSIKNLSIKLNNCEVINFPKLNNAVKDLLKACPELETLFVSKLTKEVMRFIVSTKSKLKTVKFEKNEEGTWTEYYQMRQANPNINRSVQFTMVDKN